jgi:hypothetical protein
LGTLPEKLLEPHVHPRVIADCEALVDHEVADLSGVAGAAVRLAYRTVRTFDAGHIPAMIESILPSVADALQPYWADFTAQHPDGQHPDGQHPDGQRPDGSHPEGASPDGRGDFGEYLARHEDEVAESLLAITDSRRRASSRMTIVKAYNTIRGGAVKHVKAALPATGALMERYVRGDGDPSGSCAHEGTPSLLSPLFCF